jgi:two-component system CheB/CheR fusion protein
MKSKVHDDLLAEISQLRNQLEEANDTLEAIRTGQIDALVVNGENGHALYTLKTADHAYRVFIEQMTEGAVTLNTAGLIIYSNSQFARMVDKNLSEVLGRQFSSYVTLEFKNVFDEMFEKGWTENAKREITILANGANIPVLLSLNALQLEDEIALSLIVTDLTIQKENERQLRINYEQLAILNKALVSSNHDLQQFASVASHDLQEPLRKIQVFSKFLKDRNFHELADEPKQYIEKIILSSQRMKMLIIDILNYSRLSADDGQFQLVNLKDLFDEIEDDFDLVISEKRASLKVGALPSVEGNNGQLRQVFHNLVSNALKFTSPLRDPQIVVTAKQFHAKELGVSLANDESYCNISIKDNGIGFDEQYATSIFSLFEKLNPKSSFEGSGIGLAIAKKIVDKHHGLIIAKSKVGEGSEFNIILPFRQQSK